MELHSSTTQGITTQRVYNRPYSPAPESDHVRQMIQNKNSTGKKQVQIMMITTESSQDESESVIVEEKERAKKHVKLQSAVMTNDSEIP